MAVTMVNMNEPASGVEAATAQETKARPMMAPALPEFSSDDTKALYERFREAWKQWEEARAVAEAAETARRDAVGMVDGKSLRALAGAVSEARYDALQLEIETRNQLPAVCKAIMAERQNEESRLNEIRTKTVAEIQAGVIALGFDKGGVQCGGVNDVYHCNSRIAVIDVALEQVRNISRILDMEKENRKALTETERELRDVSGRM